MRREKLKTLNHENYIYDDNRKVNKKTHVYCAINAP